MKRSSTVTTFALLLLLRLTAASAQLVEADCATSWPGFPFPEAMFLDHAQSKGLDIAWREFSAPDAVRAGQPPAPRIARSAPTWVWHSDLSAIARTSDLGVFISRFNNGPQGWDLGVTDGYMVSAWAYVAKGTPKLIASTWMQVKSDRLPLSSECVNRLIVIPGNFWSTVPRVPGVSDVAAAASPPVALRDADNALIARATCRERWPPIIEASGENHGRFLVPGVGEVIGGASLRPIYNLLPKEPVRWRRLKFLASRDGTLGLSIGRLVNCDDSNAVQTYVSAWVRDSESWRLELLAIVP
jgi:hypothetical protein